MIAVEVQEQISTDLNVLWTAVTDFKAHAEWMQDAVDIRFVTEQREGVDTSFDCATKVGPLRLTDRMTVTAWEPNRLLSVSHHGLVTGNGSFHLAQSDDGSTTLSWREVLKFPWFMGGVIGELIAKPIFIRMWRSNLARLRARIEVTS